MFYFKGKQSYRAIFTKVVRRCTRWPSSQAQSSEFWFVSSRPTSLKNHILLHSLETTSISKEMLGLSPDLPYPTQIAKSDLSTLATSDLSLEHHRHIKKIHDEIVVSQMPAHFQLALQWADSGLPTSCYLERAIASGHIKMPLYAIG